MAMIVDEIEKAVLDWYGEHCSDQAIVAQLRSAVPGEREITSIGFFTEILLPDAIAPSATPSSGGLAFEGCALFAPELELYADCILHSQDGRISYLEIYTVADGHPLEVSAFELRGIESNFIDLRDA